MAFVVGMFALVAEATPERTSQPPRDWNGFFRTATEAQMRYELRYGLNPNTAMLIAAPHNPDAGVIRALLEAGADVNVRRQNSSTEGTPLIEAARTNNLAVVRALVEGGADLNAIRIVGAAHVTPLRAAAERRRPHNPAPEIVIFLLEAGADPTIGVRRVQPPFTPSAIHTLPDAIRGLEGTEALRMLERRHNELWRN